ncbi:catecholate siderophore receptor CirA [Luteitalea sp. TBR-22]|uniref:TonB-dependent receptor n=1 Tax=Luteitalea sp. TBR-22 TaxID=2802971 RepID=UPI001AF409FC|nr:TonB-dependent receptor [Luteitalea sp. TBR-22]BCS31646.1 catecholate siderophore receptor CirA [Luteitalea sp. TBR-22]
MIRSHALPLAGLLLALLSAPASAARLTGTVTSGDGHPVSDARVVLESPTGPVASTRTDRTGAYLLDAPDGDYVLRVVAEGFSGPSQRVQLTGAAATLDIRVDVAALAESVVVTAGLAPVTRSGTGASLTVLDQTELRARQLESSVDALRSVPGLAVLRSGGRGAVTSLFPRGGESDFTLVLVDGIRLNDMGGSFDAAHLPLFDLDRIEVVRGPQSALYGTDAVGGVVQLVTRRGGPFSAGGLFEAGSFGTWRANGTANGTTGRFRWGGGVERLASDGFTGTAPGTGEVVSNDDYTRTDATVSLGYQGDRLLLSGLLRAGDNTRGVPGPYGSDPNDTYAGVDRVSRNDNRTLAAGASATWRLRPAAQVRGAFSLADRDSTYLSIYTPDTPTASGNRLYSGRGSFDLAWLGVAWTAGGEYMRERAQSAYFTGLENQEIPVDRTQVGAFGEGRFERGRLALQGGLRYERVVRDALEGNRSVFSPRPPFAASTTSVVNPRLSVSYRLLGGDTTWLRLRGNFGTGMRAPGAFEIAFTDNPGLKPERTRSIDGGVETGWFGGRLIVDAVYFRNEYDDLIVTVARVPGTTSYRSDNISNALAEGVEGTVSFRPTAFMTVRGGVVGQRTEILANDGRPVAPSPFTVGDPLLRRPELAGFADVILTAGRTSGFVRVDSRGDTQDIDPSFGANAGIFTNPGYLTVDAGASWRVLERVEVFGRALNLLDTDYEEIFGFPALGRSVMVGVRVAASR